MADDVEAWSMMFEARSTMFEAWSLMLSVEFDVKRGV